LKASSDQGRTVHARVGENELEGCCAAGKAGPRFLSSAEDPIIRTMTGGISDGSEKVCEWGKAVRGMWRGHNISGGGGGRGEGNDEVGEKRGWVSVRGVG